MTRLASILGVATVATLVLLSGCESPMKTDYAKDLQGTWKVTIEDRQVSPNPADLVTTTVTAIVTRSGTNKGTVALEITNVPPSLTVPPQIDVTGDIAVTDTKITVSSVMVEPMELTADPTLSAVVAQGIELTYEHSDDGSKLTVSNTELFSILLGPTHTKLTLTKQ